MNNRRKKRLPTALVTTPESLTILLSYSGAREKFNSLQLVVVDEWHELLGSKRGVLVELALARLRSGHRPLEISRVVCVPTYALELIEVAAARRFLERGRVETRNPAFLFNHKPKTVSSFCGIAGHLHPAVNVTGKGRQKETLSRFCFSPRFALLPAFGSFTGNQVIRPSPEDRIYVIAGDQVIEMKNNVL